MFECSNVRMFSASERAFALTAGKQGSARAREKKRKPGPRFELGLLDSKSRVIAITLTRQMLLLQGFVCYLNVRTKFVLSLQRLAFEDSLSKTCRTFGVIVGQVRALL